MIDKNKVAVISTGNGGQSLAAWYAHKGYNVSLYARQQERVDMFLSNRFTVRGVLEAEPEIALISKDMASLKVRT